MIKSLSNISEVSCIDIVGNESRLLPLKRISYFEKEMGGGGFGDVFKIESINGAQTRKYVLKIITNDNVKEHAYETISLLHTKIKKALIKDEGFVINTYPELLGMPFIAFKAFNEIDNKEIVAFIIHNLHENEFEDFGADNFDKGKFIQIDLKERIYYTFQLVKAIKFLNELDFLHSDISENAIWINDKVNKIALIDYDSGYHIDRQNKPTTVGKIGQWIGSTFRNILAKEIDADKLTTAERIDEENWVVANAIFELIFGASPYFFLKDADEKTKVKYLKKHTWPEINLDDDLFNTSNSLAYEGIINLYNLLNNNGFDKLISAFNKVFNSGYKTASKRLRVPEWYDILFELGEGLDLKPNILNFKADKLSINSSKDVVNFEWKQSRGNKIYINDVLVNDSNYKSSFNDTINVVLKVVNEFGETKEELSVIANKIAPIINYFKSDIQERVDLTPVTLSWETKFTEKVIISEINKELESIGNCEIDPRVNKKIILTAIGNFNQEATTEIEIKLTEPKINEFKYEINIEKGIDNIDLFWKTENAKEVIIKPRIDKVNNSGETSVSINEKTEFTLTAKGYFKEVTKTIETQPFPIPIIKGILIPTPIINIDTVIPESNLQIPHILNNNLNISFNNSISFNNVIPDFIKLENQIDKIETVENIKINKISPINLFNNLFKKIINTK